MAGRNRLSSIIENAADPGRVPEDDNASSWPMGGGDELRRWSFGENTVRTCDGSEAAHEAYGADDDSESPGSPNRRSDISDAGHGLEDGQHPEINRVEEGVVPPDGKRLPDDLASHGAAANVAAKDHHRLNKSVTIQLDIHEEVCDGEPSPSRSRAGSKLKPKSKGRSRMSEPSSARFPESPNPEKFAEATVKIQAAMRGRMSKRRSEVENPNRERRKTGLPKEAIVEHAKDADHVGSLGAIADAKAKKEKKIQDVRRIKEAEAIADKQIASGQGPQHSAYRAKVRALEERIDFLKAELEAKEDTMKEELDELKAALETSET